MPQNGPMGWSNFQPFGFKFGLYSLLLGIFTCKNKKVHMGQIWALFWYWPFLGAPKYEASSPWIRIFLTFAILRQCVNLQYLSERGHMEMGQFWVPESAVGHKWSNFQPFCFKFWTVHMTSRYLQLENRKHIFGTICAPFGVLTLFWDTKIRRSHIYGTCASMDMKFWQTSVA